MTIRDLLQDKSTMKQIAILMRADRLFGRLFKDQRGRYYAGKLSDEEIALLNP
jgi:hypothetical protein